MDNKEKIKEVKVQLFDLQVLLSQINQQIADKIRQLNDLQREQNVCLPSQTSSNR